MTKPVLPGLLTTEHGLSTAELDDITRNQRYGVEYQPIVSMDSGEIVAYEALARFYHADGHSIPPSDFFTALHSNPPRLRQVESALKHLQINLAPEGYKLFLNLDPHALSPGNEDDGELLKTIAEHPRAVVELIENTDIHHARASQTLHRQLKELGIATALDDIGASHSLLSLELLTQIDYLKFDRSWLARLNQPSYRYLFRALLDYARQSEKQTVLEGVESVEMLAVAKEFELDCIQGFLYRPRFISYP